jgi:exodeoxyribonuclease VII small subunit
MDVVGKTSISGQNPDSTPGNASLVRKPSYNCPFYQHLGPNSMSKASSTQVKTDPSDAPQSYEGAISEIEELVSQMETGKLPLEKLLVSYKRGAQLLKYCREQLDSVEEQIKVLDDGELKSWNNSQ